MPPRKLQGAGPPLAFVPPAYTPWLRRTFSLLIPLLLRRQGVQAIGHEGIDELARLYAAHAQGRIRLLVAFRHPSTRDPLLMAWLLWHALPRAARRLGLDLHGPVHCQFLYDRGIPLWAGALVGWVFSHLGGIPIQRGKLDRQALRTARDLVVHGPFPLAIAPEGATNNHGELISPLEPGLAQMAFWACEDLEGEERDERVLVVPLGLRYRLRRPDWSRIDHCLALLERRLGLPAPPDGGADHAEARYRRFLAVAEGLLSDLERFYRRAHGLVLEPAGSFQERLVLLRHRVLELAERPFSLRSQGSLEERCRRIEQAAWDRMYRADLAELAPVSRSLADWTAAEADLALGHMRLVEPFAAISGTYVATKPTPDRYAELLQILWRAIALIEGRPEDPPFDLGPLKAHIRLGTPIDVTARRGDYRQDRRQAVDDLTVAVGDALERAIADPA